MSRKMMTGLALLAGVALTGCSPRDEATTTPYYHVGTPTNRSTVQSWENNREPFYTQPGVNRGQPVTTSMPPETVNRGFEPYDSIAEAVYNALVADGSIDAKYISSSAKDGTVILIGSVATLAQKQKAMQIAQAVPGVQKVRNEITVVPEQN